MGNRKDLGINEFGCYGESAGWHLALSVNMTIDYMSEFGVKPSVISSLVPMAGLDFNTESYTSPERQTEMAGFLVQKCWLAFAGLDMYNSSIMKALSKNDHLGIAARKFYEHLPTMAENNRLQQKIDELIQTDTFCPGLASDETLAKLLKN